MDFQHCLIKAMNILSNTNNPRREAEILLEFVTGKTRSFLLAFDETLLTTEQEARYFILVARRKIGEPLAYLIGEYEFWSLPLYVSKSTLIPRQDTECLVEHALLHLPNKSSRILDLGTGTGAIALALASERPDCSITGVDLILDVVDLARRNIKRLSMCNVSVFQSFWFDALSNQRFDMIVSNPPYLDIQDPHLSLGDVRFEPITALVADNKGMADLNYIILNSCKYLVPGGWLLVEHGWTQGRAVQEIFIKAGYQHIKTCFDYSGNERLTLGERV